VLIVCTVLIRYIRYIHMVCQEDSRPPCCTGGICGLRTLPVKHYAGMAGKFPNGKSTLSAMLVENLTNSVGAIGRSPVIDPRATCRSLLPFAGPNECFHSFQVPGPWRSNQSRRRSRRGVRRNGTGSHRDGSSSASTQSTSTNKT
jgi:hypothetical protein